MNSRHLGVAVGIATLLAGSGSAYAQFRVHTSGRIATGVTDNVDSTASNKQADGYTEFEPGLVLSFGSQRAAHQLQYSIAAALFYVRFSDQLTVTNRLNWISFIELSESLRLRLTGGGAIGKTNLASLGQSAGASGPQTGLSPSNDWFASLSAAQGLDWEVDTGLVIDQSLAFDAFAPFDNETQPQTYEVSAGLGATYAFEISSLGVRLSQGLAVSTAYTLVATDPGQEDQHQPRLEVALTRTSVLYGRRLTPAWSVDASVGLARVGRLDRLEDQLFRPLALVALRYGERDVETSLSAEQTARQSLFIGEALESQELRLRGRVPLRRLGLPRRWFAEGTVGYDHGQVLDLDGLDIHGTPTAKLTGNHLHSLLIDMGVSWRMSDALEWSLRYQYTRQWIVGEVLATEPFGRHLVLLAAVFGYPPQRVRTRTPRERTQMTRQDWQRFFEAEAAGIPDMPPRQRQDN